MESDEVLEVVEEVDKPKQRRQFVPVRIVQTEGASALVEWDDYGLYRAFVPAEEIDEGRCPAAVLKAGIPYGEDWSLYLENVSITAAEISQALHRAGFWTARDIEQRVNRAQNVINSAVGISAARLRRRAANQEE